MIYKKADTLLTNKHQETLVASSPQEDISEEIITNEVTQNPEEDSLVQKLLQQTETENEEEIEFVNRVEELERDLNLEEDSEIIIEEIEIIIEKKEEKDPLIEEFRLIQESWIEISEHDNEKLNTKSQDIEFNEIEEDVFIWDNETDIIVEENNKQDEIIISEAIISEAIMITPEIYNSNSNIETINKQKLQFESLISEIEHLGKRGMSIEYEKKLIEATIDFSDDVYFNTLLWDYYMENNDFKKAQTIYKKLYLQDALNDNALYKLWIINLELWDIPVAEYLLTKAKDLKPENPKYYQILAEVKYNLEKIDESVELMEKAVDLRPTKFEYMEILGKLYKETNNIKLYYKTLLKMNVIEPLNQKIKLELIKFQEWNY